MSESRDEFAEVVELLRAERREATPLELDAIKARVMRRAARSRPSRLRSRLVVSLVAVSLLAGATGGVIAGPISKHSGKDASKSQYQPGKGCGDKNHAHQRQDECKKPPK